MELSRYPISFLLASPFCCLSPLQLSSICVCAQVSGHTFPLHPAITPGDTPAVSRRLKRAQHLNAVWHLHGRHLERRNEPLA